MLASPRQGNADPYKKKPSAISRQKIYINTSSVSLWLTPSPTGEGWRKSLLSSAHKLPHARQPYYAGVQTMRARICSASSCAMFARVVWLKLRRVNKLPTFALPFASRTRHALLPATNSCTPHGGSEGGRRESSLLTFGTFGHAKVQ